METVDEVVKETEMRAIMQVKAQKIKSLKIWFATATGFIVSIFLLVFIFIGPFYDWLDSSTNKHVPYWFGTKEQTILLMQLAMIGMAAGTVAIMWAWYNTYKWDIVRE